MRGALLSMTEILRGNVRLISGENSGENSGEMSSERLAAWSAVGSWDGTTNGTVESVFWVSSVVSGVNWITKGFFRTSEATRDPKGDMLSDSDGAAANCWPKPEVGGATVAGREWWASCFLPSAMAAEFIILNFFKRPSGDLVLSVSLCFDNWL